MKQISTDYFIPAKKVPEKDLKLVFFGLLKSKN